MTAQQDFRREVHTVLADCTPIASGEPRHDAECHPWHVYRALGEIGALAPDWPVEYGGRGLSLLEAGIVAEELPLHGVPDSVYGSTIHTIGRFLLAAADERQRQRYLPAIARGEMVAVILFSEPEVGSDLASLSTRARHDGSHWRVSGTKTYSIKADIADYGLCLTRTSDGASRYAGLTLFMVPLRGEGVRIEPIPSMNPETFCRVCLDEAPVADDDVIGEVGSGWTLVDEALSVERTGLDLEYSAKVRFWFNHLVERLGAGNQHRDPGLADRLAALESELEAGRLLAWRILEHAARSGQRDDLGAAASKWYNGELGRKVVRLSLELLGLEAASAAIPAAAICEAPGLTLGGGSSEMMLYILSSEILREGAEAA